MSFLEGWRLGLSLTIRYYEVSLEGVVEKLKRVLEDVSEVGVTVLFGFALKRSFVET